MSGLVDIARRIRLHPLKCPHCNRNIKTVQFLKELFEEIVIEAKEKGRVEIINFGAFYVSKMPGKTIKTKLDNVGTVKYGPRWVLRFNGSKTMKKRLNLDKED